MLEVFREYRPQVVFHAAAHKHVPILEDHPQEALLTNVLGTANVVEAAAAVGTERFVLISTDKAVRPTSVMGGSKRIAEEIVRGSRGPRDDRCAPSASATCSAAAGRSCRRSSARSPPAAR